MFESPKKQFDREDNTGFLQGLAGLIDRALQNRFGPLGFGLVVFRFDKPGHANYISNAVRSDMIAALRETAERLEKAEDNPTLLFPKKKGGK